MVSIYYCTTTNLPRPTASHEGSVNYALVSVVSSSQKDVQSSLAHGKSKRTILLRLGSNQKPSGCLNYTVITAERATNCATED
jgi:hypothetical protein